MAQMLRYYGEVYDGIIRVPMEVTCELLNTVGGAREAIEAIAMASAHLAASLRAGDTSAVFGRGGVDLVATLKEDADGHWYVLLEPAGTRSLR